MIRDEEIIRDKLEFYKERDEAVHLKLKTPYVSIEKPFRNGKTIELKEDSFIFDEEKLGKILIYLREVLDVLKREEKR